MCRQCIVVHSTGMSVWPYQFQIASHRPVLVALSNSAFTLATSEPYQTGLVLFSKADISRATGTCRVPVVLLISAFENTKPVWHGSEVASVNAL